MSSASQSKGGAVPYQHVFRDLFASREEQARIRKIEKEEGRRINLMVLGQTGSGKSTTINNLLRDCSARAEASELGSAALASVTKEPSSYEGFLYDKKCCIVDQAGFGDSDNLDDAAILGRALMYVATEVPRQKIDGFLIFQSYEDSRCYIKRNVDTVKAMWGEQAAKRCIVVITKAEVSINPNAKKKARQQFDQKAEGYKSQMEECGVPIQNYVLWFNTIEDEEYAGEIMAAMMCLEEKDKEFYLPFMRRTIQDIATPFTNETDPFPSKLKAAVEDLAFEVKRKWSKNERVTFDGVTATRHVKPAWTEERYDPSAASLLGSVITFGIAAACGVNTTYVDHPEEVTYPEPHASKAIDYTFPQEGVTFGVKLHNPTGDGEVKNVVKHSNKRIAFELASIGPNIPHVVAELNISDPAKDVDVLPKIKSMFEEHMFKQEGDRRIPRTLVELKATVVEHVKDLKA